MMTPRKTILITGATGGIGRATAIAFAKTGEYNLALHYNAAKSDVVNQLEEEIAAAAQSKVEIKFFQADLGNFDHIRRLHEEVVENFGKVDVLFNNAGTTGGQSGAQNLSDIPIDTFERTWRVNTASGILLTQLCLPDMEKQGWGRIIFDSSVAAFTGGLVGPHYASSKSAIHGFVHWLAGSVARKGVTVNAVAPAVIQGTAMMGDGGEGLRRVADKLPVGRLGLPEEIAGTVLWMVRTAYVTNKVITVDGGMYPY